MKKILLILCPVVVLFFVLLNGCSGGVLNSISDSHFEADGTPRDTIAFFEPKEPESVKLYIESSGSMNGFFRANQSNKFKKTVWSVFSGLQDMTDQKVYPLSQGGEIDEPVEINAFRSKMNQGQFVSSSETHIPLMLKSIIDNIDRNKEDAAVLVSDMKYSPMGAAAAPSIAQYQEEIRNLTARHPYAVSFVCAGSEFLAPDGSVAEESSPYYFIIIGKSENVAFLRNWIMTWAEATDSFIESGDLGMNYKNPPYSIHSIKNGLAHSQFPNNVITTYSRDVNDTCSFVLRIDLTQYPAGLVTANVDSCLNVATTNGANVTTEVLDYKDDHHYNEKFERKAYADVLVKVFNFPLDDEVVEWTFNNRKGIDGRYSDQFNYIITGNSESELDRTFSFNKFIKGHCNARNNDMDLETSKESQREPRHHCILISHESE